MPAPDKKPDAAPAMVDMIVANGRTVQTGNTFSVKPVITEVNGREITSYVQMPNPGKHIYTEGETVSLPADEAARLRESGHVLAEGDGNSRPRMRDVVNEPDAPGMVRSEIR